MNKADSTAQHVYHQGQSHQIIQTQIYPKKNQWIVIYEGILKEYDIKTVHIFLETIPLTANKRLRKYYKIHSWQFEKR